jgi:hypothetical protein
MTILPQNTPRPGSSLLQKSAEALKRQRQFDEQQNTIEFRMRPSQIQKAREKIWKLIEDTALHLFTIAGCDAAKSVSLVPFGELGSQLGRLYHGVFEDPYRMIEFESEGSLSGYHVLLALLGRINLEVLKEESPSALLAGTARSIMVQTLATHGKLRPPISRESLTRMRSRR